MTRSTLSTPFSTRQHSQRRCRHGALLLALASGLAAPAGWAQGAAPAATAAPAAAAASATPDAADLARGEVRKVDRDSGKLTLRHGEIKSLDMPPMTMVFVVQDKAWLDGLKVGDQLRFKAARVRGQITITEIAEVTPATGQPPSR